MTDTNHTDGLASPIAGTLYEGVVARTHTPGDPLRYPWGVAYRDERGLDEIVEQLPGLIVAADTDQGVQHPPALIRDGAAHRKIGEVIAARREGDRVIARVMIHDRVALSEIQSGTRELSLGYESQVGPDRYQRSISLDHLAVVTRARCGSACSLQMDACSCGCASLARDRAAAAKARPEVLARYRPLDELHREMDRDRLAASLAITGTRPLQPSERCRLERLLGMDAADSRVIFDEDRLDDRQVAAFAVAKIDETLRATYKRILDAERGERAIDRMPLTTQRWFGRTKTEDNNMSNSAFVGGTLGFSESQLQQIRQQVTGATIDFRNLNAEETARLRQLVADNDIGVELTSIIETARMRARPVVSVDEREATAKQRATDRLAEMQQAVRNRAPKGNRNP